jgi:hypothetical protein
MFIHIRGMPSIAKTDAAAQRKRSSGRRLTTKGCSMKRQRLALARVATTLLAILCAAPACAGTGKFDPFSDGARREKFDPFTDGAKVGKFDVFTDGANMR